MQILQPSGWPRPKGYSNGVSAQGRQVYVAGQVGWDTSERMVSDDFVAQCEQVLKNIVAVLKEAGAGPEHLTRLTWYVTDKEAYLQNQRELGRAYQAVIGKHYPAMTLVVVSALVEDGAKVEVEATAVVPA